jgi:hypothetical protein
MTTQPKISGPCGQSALELEEGPLHDPRLGPAFQALFPEMQGLLALRAT